MATMFLLGEAQQTPDQPEWGQVGESAGVGALDAKALYVLGLLRHLVEAAGKLLNGKDPMWLPAYVMVADAAELLGRCYLGHTEPSRLSTKRLSRGFEALLGGPGGIIRTAMGHYSVRDLIRLRNFTMHGAGTPEVGTQFDTDLLRELLRRLANELTRYWTALQSEKSAPVRGRRRQALLARALILPLLTGGQPLFVQDMLNHIQRSDPGASLLYENNWR